MKNKKLFSLVFIFFILIINLVSASMPPTHKYIDYSAINTYQGSSTEFYEACVKYPDLCFVGNMFTDLSVVYYYVNKGSKYEITHSPGFCVNMLKNAVGSEGVTQEEEFACAVGSCVHAVEDHPVHTIMVPYAIRHTGLVNEIIHVFAEQHQANILLKEHPEISDQIINLEEESWNKCIPLLKRTLNGYNEYESDIREGKTDDLINTFIAEIQNSVDPNSDTSYDISFKNKVTIFGSIGLVPAGFLLMYLGFMALWFLLTILIIFKKNKGWFNYISIVLFGIFFVIQLILFISLLSGNAFATFVFLIKPISNIVPIGSYDNMLNTQIDNVHSLFQKGESFVASIDNPKVASGFEELKKANEDVKWIDYIIIAVLSISLLILIYLNFKKKPQKSGFNL